MGAPKESCRTLQKLKEVFRVGMDVLFLEEGRPYIVYRGNIRCVEPHGAALPAKYRNIDGRVCAWYNCCQSGNGADMVGRMPYFEEFHMEKDVYAMKIMITDAGGGLGQCLCSEAVRRGWQVVALNRSAPSPMLRALIDAGQVSFYQADLSDREMLLPVIRRIVQEETSLDGLVNNAGVLLGRESTLETLSMEDMERSMAVNLYAPMELTRAVLPLLRKSPSAGIVNISSSAAAIKGTRAIDYPYAISKCAFTMFSEKLRVYLEQDGIRVAAVHPGWMRTAMGGNDAAVEPAEVAVHVLDILCGKQPVTAIPAFVNRFGAPVLDRNDI